MQIKAVEVAQQLGCHPSTIHRLCVKGTIHAVKGLDTQYPTAWFVDSLEVRRYFKNRSELWKKPRKQCKQLSETDKAYMAGLVEGEGCFTAFITRQRNKWWTTHYFIQIIMADPEPIKWLENTTGLGYVFQRKRQKQGYLDLWGWRCESHVACAIVEQIMPYLKFKYRQATLFLQLEKRVVEAKDYRWGKSNNMAIPQEEWIERQKIIEQIQALNKRTGKVRRTEFSIVQ